jgi:hypothetical protein
MTEFATTITSSGTGHLLIWATIGVGTGIYLFVRGFRLLKRRRLILNTPSSKIRSASIGLVEISGLATGPYVITSPIKQVDCFYYRSVAWELRKEGKNSKWVKIGEEILHVPFYIDDGTGTLLVNPDGADMDLHCDFKDQYNNSFFISSTGMSDGASQFLSRHGADFNRPLKVEEYCIKPKNFLFVLGTLAQNSGVSAVPAIPPAEPASTAAAAVVPGHSRPLVDATGAPLVGANYRQVIHLTADSTPVPATEMSQQQRVAAALVKAGITNPAAWLVAGVKQQDAAQVKPYIPIGNLDSGVGLGSKENAFAGHSAFDPHPPVVLMKGTHNSTFLISWRSQRDLVSSLGWKSALMIWGGPVLTLVCLYILLAHFNGL